MTLDPKSACLMVGGRMSLADTIEHEGERLIVVLWYGNPAEGLRRPEYVIPLASVPYKENHTDPKFPQYLVDGVFPETLFDGSATRPERRRFGVRKGPDIAFPLETTTH